VQLFILTNDIKAATYLKLLIIKWLITEPSNMLMEGVSVNLAENFNSHFKRGINGTYYQISRKHSQRYADEFAFRRNTRKFNNQERFDLLLSSSIGQRLTYQQLIN